MKLPVIVIGGGGHAKVLIDALRLKGIKIIGITEVAPDLIGKQILGITVIGNDEVITAYKSTDLELVNGIGSIGLPLKRKFLFEKFKNLEFVFTSVIHPSAVVASDVFIGEGTQIMAGVVVQTGSKIGCNSIINTKVSVDHDCIIGDHVHLAPGVTLSGDVKVGNGAHVGIGVNIIQGVKVGRSAIVGAGALVLDDVSDEAVVIGVPAKMVRK
jgi:sugar O-acyltransferase (sialic acid O-acetyltransferase NeuD family)